MFQLSSSLTSNDSLMIFFYSLLHLHKDLAVRNRVPTKSAVNQTVDVEDLLTGAEQEPINVSFVAV